MNSTPFNSGAGIGPAMAARLRALGIRTTEKLLEAAKSPKDRKALAEKLEVDEHVVLRWANLTDRMRIKGVREPYAELLKDAGVDTVRELKYRNPGHLARAMAEANAKRRRVRLLPSENRVGRWIEANLRYDAQCAYEWRDFDGVVDLGKYGGCADHAVVFGALARACGIPCVWVKTMDADWIREFTANRGKCSSWRGHVYLEVHLRGRWMLLDASQLVLYEDYRPGERLLPVLNRLRAPSSSRRIAGMSAL